LSDDLESAIRPLLSDGDAAERLLFMVRTLRRLNC